MVVFRACVMAGAGESTPLTSLHSGLGPEQAPPCPFEQVVISLKAARYKCG